MYDKESSSSVLTQNNTLICILFENTLQIPFDYKKKKTYNTYLLKSGGWFANVDGDFIDILLHKKPQEK